MNILEAIGWIDSIGLKEKTGHNIYQYERSRDDTQQGRKSTFGDIVQKKYLEGRSGRTDRTNTNRAPAESNNFSDSQYKERGPTERSNEDYNRSDENYKKKSKEKSIPHIYEVEPHRFQLYGEDEMQQMWDEAAEQLNADKTKLDGSMGEKIEKLKAARERVIKHRRNYIDVR